MGQVILDHWPPLLAMLVLQIADVVTTLGFLRRGGREANPVVRWIMTRYGNMPGLVLKVALAMALTLVAAWYGASWSIWALCAVYAVIVWRNTRVAR